MIEVGLVDVEIHHARIGTADLRKVRVAETAPDLSGAAPVFDFRLSFRIAAFHDARDDRVALSGAFQIRYHLSHRAAGVKFAKPSRGVRVRVIGGFLLLEID